ncbi:MAG: sugar phosphate isomerase/epimerase [Anaerolineae bacterium]
MIGAPDLDQETLAIYSGDLAAAFRKLAGLGYDGVELMTKDPAQLDGAKIRRWLEDNQLELVGLCTGHVYGEDRLGLVGPDPEICRQAMTRLKSFVDFAALHFGEGTLINIGRSRGPGLPYDTPGTLARMADAFGELADYALPRGIRLVLEPINVHQAHHIHTTQQGLAMVKRVGRPNFGLMLDVYHMNIEDVDIYDSFREAGDLCWFVHLADNNRRWPGSAHLDFEQIIRVLNEIGYDGYVSLEILPWPDPDTAARSSIEFLRQYIPG